ncbi:MAG TPA: TSUP family transporter [Holophagaceae bacterium]|nr:TSUP family transporter [Holophagaceae bacterium]
MHLAPLPLLLLVLVTFAAAALNGLLGHGFSSLTVPLGLLVTTNRLLNPVLVLLELPLNLGAFLSSRHAFPKVARSLLPFALALLPGLALGSLALRWLPAGPLKLASYLLLLPLVLVSALGATRPARRSGEGALGFATGLLYGLTTLSGPTLSLHFQRQGLPKAEYRAAVSALRLLESSLAAAAYAALGLLTPGALRDAGPLLPGVLLGLGAGTVLLGRVGEEGFRRFAVLFNVFTVSYGLARALSALGILPAWAVGGAWFLLATFALWALVEQAPRLRRLGAPPDRDLTEEVA